MTGSGNHSHEPCLDIAANRKACKWSRRELAGRILWALAWPLFGLSPRPLWGWRRFLLRAFGAEIGRGAHIHPTVRIFIPWTLAIGAEAAVGDGAILYGLGQIRIGPQATISQHAHLCAGTHDHQRVDMRLVKASIEIGKEAWICADAFVGPDVRIGPRAILGARGVAMSDLAADAIAVGNPARVIGSRRLDGRS